MKSVVNVAEAAKEKPFPKLMISDNECVVLFTDPVSGTCISPGRSLNSMGIRCETWCKEYFTDFNGTVTLSND